MYGGVVELFLKKILFSEITYFVKLLDLAIQIVYTVNSSIVILKLSKVENVWDFRRIAYKLLSDSLKRELGVFLLNQKKEFFECIFFLVFP